MQAISDFIFGPPSAPALQPNGANPAAPVPGLPNPNPNAPGPVGQNHHVSWIRELVTTVTDNLIGVATSPILRIAVCIVVFVVCMFSFVALGTSALTPEEITKAAFSLVFLMVATFTITLQTVFKMTEDPEETEPPTPNPEPAPVTFGSALEEMLDIGPV